ncbi:DMT family transporter [Actinokineospora diospyrosa]|nr:multidrug efflux SMR transporter [Actinokineospora diospyrosa]
MSNSGECAMLAWVYLGLAITFEVVATSLMKSTQGFTQLWPTVTVLAGYAIAFFMLAKALQQGMEIGVGYAIWSALGTTVIVIVGALFLNEALTPVKVIGVVLVVAGVVTLNLGGAH